MFFKFQRLLKMYDKLYSIMLKLILRRCFGLSVISIKTLQTGYAHIRNEIKIKASIFEIYCALLWTLFSQRRTHTYRE